MFKSITYAYNTEYKNGVPYPLLFSIICTLVLKTKCRCIYCKFIPYHLDCNRFNILCSYSSVRSFFVTYNKPTTQNSTRTITCTDCWWIIIKFFGVLTYTITTFKDRNNIFAFDIAISIDCPQLICFCFICFDLILKVYWNFVYWNLRKRLLKAYGKNPGAWQILIYWKFYDFELCNKINAIAIWVYSTQTMAQSVTWP